MPVDFAGLTRCDVPCGENETMKSTVRISSGLLVLSLFLTSASAAWAQACLQAGQAHSRVRAEHPADVLGSAVIRWMACCPSTSGVEQNFGLVTQAAGILQKAVDKGDALFGSRRTDDRALTVGQRETQLNQAAGGAL